MRAAHSEFKRSHALLGPAPQLHHQISVTLGHVTSHPDGVGSVGKHNLRTAPSYQRRQDSLQQHTSTAPVELVQMPPRQEVVCERLGVAHTLNTGVHEAGVAKVTEASGTFLCRNWVDKRICNSLRES